MLTKTMPLAPLAALLAMSRPAAALSDVRNDAMDAGKLEQLLKDVKAEVSRVGDDVKRTAESALKQSADAGKVTAEVAQKADQLLTAQGALKDAQNKLKPGCPSWPIAISISNSGCPAGSAALAGARLPSRSVNRSARPTPSSRSPRTVRVAR